MKKIFLPLLLLVVVYQQGHTQKIENINVTLEIQNESLRSAIKKIEKQTALMFVFSPTDIGPYTNISIPMGTRTVKETLNLLLRGTPLQYNQTKNYVTVFQPEEPEPERSDTLTVKGKVVDAETLQPLAGVNILIKGTARGATTDVNGTYTIETGNTDALVFSHVGFESYEASVNNRSKIDVWLAQVVLEEVTIHNAGYWQIAEEKKTGNISRVIDKAIQSQPVSNPLLALAGRVAGLYVKQASGVPGSYVQINVRGQNSLMFEAMKPLVIVDGMPVNSRSLSSSYVGGDIVPSASPYNSILPADIESMQVLKDADATAIYGARGANGVILITTKKGHIGRPKIELNINSGVGSITRKMDLLNTTEYLEMRREAFRNDNEPMTAANAYDILLWDTTRYTDWQKELIGRTANMTNAQISLSAGKENTAFNFGISYSKETTAFLGDFSNRKGSIHFKTNYLSDDHRFLVTLSSRYVLDAATLPRFDITQHALRLPPTAPPLYVDGKLNWANGSWLNPVGFMKKIYESRTGNLITDALFEYRLPIDLHFRLNVGYQTIHFDEHKTNPVSSFAPEAGIKTGEATFGTTDTQSVLFEPQATYSKRVAREGKLTLHIGATVQVNTWKNKVLYGGGYRMDNSIDDLIDAETIVGLSSENSTYKYAGFFFRANCDLKGRYIINLTGRRDASSRFGPDKKLGNFGAIGAAWVFSNEKFMPESFVSFGKLRTSYGITGNDQIGDYEYYDKYEIVETSSGRMGLVPTKLTNASYTYEKTKKFEVALEIGLWDNRVLFATTYYNNHSTDVIGEQQLPKVTGFNRVMANLPAIILNRGFESEASAVIARGRLAWTTGINVTLPRNKLVAYPTFQNSNVPIGKSVNTRMVYHYLGVDSKTGIYKFEDVDGDGSIDANDLQARKEVAQQFYGGFQNTLRWGRFEVDVLFQFVKQTGYNYHGVGGPIGVNYNRPRHVMSRWQKEGDITDVQKFTTSPTSEATLAAIKAYDSDIVITNASFTRLKNLSLSYWLPTKINEKMGLENCKVYLQGQNLLTFTRDKGLDPESQYQYFLPPMRFIVIGAHITL